jgi:hypothetical protein
MAGMLLVPTLFILFFVCYALLGFISRRIHRRLHIDEPPEPRGFEPIIVNRTDESDKDTHA